MIGAGVINSNKSGVFALHGDHVAEKCYSVFFGNEGSEPLYFPVLLNLHVIFLR